MTCQQNIDIKKKQYIYIIYLLKETLKTSTVQILYLKESIIRINKSQSVGTWLCVCEIWFWNKSIHTSRGSPPVSLDDDLRSPIASTDSLPVVNEFGWLFKGDAREKEDEEPSLAREAQDSLLCNRK